MLVDNVVFPLSIFLRSHSMISTHQGNNGGEDIVEASIEKVRDHEESLVTAFVPQSSAGRPDHPKVVDGTPVFVLAFETTLWDTWAGVIDTLMERIESYMSSQARRPALRRTRHALKSIGSMLAGLRVCALRSNLTAEQDASIIAIFAKVLRHNWRSLELDWEERTTPESWQNYYNECVEDRDEFRLSLVTLIDSIRQNASSSSGITQPLSPQSTTNPGPSNGGTSPDGFPLTIDGRSGEPFSPNHRFHRDSTICRVRTASLSRGAPRLRGSSRDIESYQSSLKLVEIENANLRKQLKELTTGLKREEYAMGFAFQKPDANGIRMDQPYLEKRELVDEILSLLRSERVILLCSPPATGKTSVMQLIAKRLGGICAYVSFIGLKDEFTANQLVENAIRQLGAIDGDDEITVFIDDAQYRYNETEYWDRLVKVSYGFGFVHRPIRYVIAATYRLDSAEDSPAAGFAQLPRFGRSKFLVNDDELRALLLQLLPPDWRLPLFVNLIVKDAAGQIGAAMSVVSYMMMHFSPTHDGILEYQLVEFFLSNAVYDALERCFGKFSIIPESSQLRVILHNCMFFSEQVYGDYGDKDRALITRMKRFGLLDEPGRDEDQQLLRISSPIARRFCVHWLYPQRATEYPVNIRELLSHVGLGNSCIGASGEVPS